MTDEPYQRPPWGPFPEMTGPGVYRDPHGNVFEIGKTAWDSLHEMCKKIVENTPCTMGVGCDEYGVCYAIANGEPDNCPKLADIKERHTRRSE